MKKEVVTCNGIKLTISKESSLTKLFEKALSKQPKNDKDKLLQDIFEESKNEPKS